MSVETLGLQVGRLAHAFIELGCIVRQVVLVLLGFLEAFRGSFVVSLQQLEQCLERVKKHLVLLNVDTLGTDGVLSQVSSHHDAEAVLADHVLFDALHAGQSPLAARLRLFLIVCLACRLRHGVCHR